MQHIFNSADCVQILPNVPECVGSHYRIENGIIGTNSAKNGRIGTVPEHYLILVAIKLIQF